VGLEEICYERDIQDDELLSGLAYLERFGMWNVMSVLRLYNRAFLEKINFSFLAGITSEDDEALPRLYVNANKVGHLSEIVYVYRRRENSISTSKTSLRQIQGLSQIVQTYLSLYKLEIETRYQKFLFTKALEYLFILAEKTYCIKERDVALLEYEKALSAFYFSSFEKALIENEMKFIFYHNIEKKRKKYNLSVYYTRRLRILYFKYVRKYGDR